MLKFLRVFAFIGMIGLSACSTGSDAVSGGGVGTVPLPSTPAQGSYALSASFDASLSVAVAYAELPRCKVNGPVICSDRMVVLRGNEIAKKVRAGLKTVETVSRAIKPDQSKLDNAIAAAKAALEEFSYFTALMRVS